MPQGWEWLIILLIALLLFGGTKLAGLGKASGRAIREFKEETKGLNDGKPAELNQAPTQTTDVVQPPVDTVAPVEAEVINPQQPKA